MADENVEHNISLSKPIAKHRHDGDAASTYEFVDLWITDIGSPEGGVSVAAVWPTVSAQ